MLSVIVPTYNERENLPELIKRTLAAFERIDEPAELLIVDDDSPDGTAGAAEQIAATHQEGHRVRVLLRTEDRGLANAVVDGFASARGDVLTVMDADLSHPPELLPKLLAAVREQGADMAIASRYVAGGGTEDWPLLRRIISRGACLLARGLTPVRDVTSGYFALRRTALEGTELTPFGYKIGLEILARLKRPRVIEVPFVFRDRRYGTSKLSGSVMAAYLWQLAALYKARFPLGIGYLQFGLVGLLGVVVDAAVFGLAYHYFDLKAMGPQVGGFLAQTLSFLTAAVFNFALNRAWTFRERAEGARLDVFVLVSSLGFVIRSLVFEAVVSMPMPQHGWAGTFIDAVTHEQIALILGILAGSLWNYYGSLRWAFARSTRAGETLPPPESLRTGGRVAVAFALVALLQLFFAAATPLAYDEAYYWQWSRHLAWGYYDHPPMIAYLIAAGTRLLGDHELGVRLVPWLLAMAMTWMVYWLARMHTGSVTAAAWAMVGALSIPLFAVGAMVATPDSPLMFFWGATLLLTLHALRTGALQHWLLAGAIAGLGLLSKYSMILLYPALLASLLAIPRGREALRGAGPYLAVATSLLIATPMLLWQLGRPQQGIFFQLRHGFGDSGAGGIPGLEGPGRLLGSQLGVVTPILFVLLAIAAARALRALWVERAPAIAPGDRLHVSEIRPFVVFPILVPLLVFGAASIFAKPQPNWLAPAYITGLALLGTELARYLAVSAARWRRATAIAGIALAALLSLYVHIEVLKPLVPYKSGVLVQNSGHDELGAWAQDLLRAQGNPAPRIVASDYKLASILAFELPDHPPTYSPFERDSGSAYLEWGVPPAPGERALYFSRRPDPPELARLFLDFETAGSLEIYRKDRLIGTIWAYVGTLRLPVTDSQKSSGSPADLP